MEIKSGATIVSDYFQGLNRVRSALSDVYSTAIIYGGPDRQSRSGCEIAPLEGLNGVLEQFESGWDKADMSRPSGV